MTRLPRSVLLLVALLAPACSDNVGSLWDRDGGGGADDGNLLEVVPAAGRIVDGRPRVRDAFPTGNGWPVTVPIVVVFSESMARTSVEGETGGGGGGGGGLPGTPRPAQVTVRVQGTTQALPVTFDWLLGDTVLLVRPNAGLPPDQSIEVVVGPEARDVDAVRKGGDAADVVATFRTDRASTIEDGQIVTILPRDNADAVVRESAVYAIFDRPVDAQSVIGSETSFRLEVGGAPVAGLRRFPLEVASLDDTRVLEFVPAATLASGARHDIVVTDEIRFGNGELDFGGRTPFSRFDTVRGAAPLRVAVGNAQVGFPDQINAANFANAALDVEVDASVPAGSRLSLRVYGFDPQTEAADDLHFVERALDLVQPGPTTVSIAIGDLLGTALRPTFGEGPLHFRCAVEVDREASSFATSAAGSTPRFDITAPEVRAFLPALPGSSTDLATDQEAILVVGRASEQLSEIELSADGVGVTAFASATDGTFALLPLPLGRRSAPLDFTMSIRDAAGNTAPQPITGRIFQRGLVTGVLAGTLTVEVYDEATFAPLEGALVVVEPDLPRKPAVGRRTARTGVDGRAVFDGLSTTRHTITVLAEGYDLTSVLDTPAAFASLPVRPIDEAAARGSLTATLGFVPSGGRTGLVGCNGFDDDLLLERPTEGTPPVSVRGAAVRTARPLAVSGVTGVFPPTGLPDIVGFACSLCGITGLTPSPPVAPLAAGAEATATLAILDTRALVVDLAAPYEIDFAAALGLGAPSATPTVRIHGVLNGFGRSLLLGAGFPSLIAGGRYAITGRYFGAFPSTLTELTPVYWVTTEAVDGDGNLSRHRQLIANLELGLTFPTGAPLGVPTVTAPSGPSTGAPALTFEDRLDASTVPTGIGFHTLTAVDPAGRRWSLVAFDGDGAAGPETVQLPDLAGLSSPGLAPGAWQLRVEAELALSGGAFDGNFGLEERRRQQVKLARSAVVTFDVR
jgi:hypothetical protein